MLIFSKKYNDVRSEYIVPLSNYKLDIRNLQYWSIKSVLLNEMKYASVPSSKTYYVYFDEETLFKGLLGDIHLFYCRTLIQRKNAINIHMKAFDISKSWNYVTAYYFYFFAITMLLRIFYRGFIYLSDSDSKNLSEIITLLSGETVSLAQGNYSFNIEKDAASYYFRLKPSNKSVHEASWNEISTILRGFLQSHPKSDEETVIFSLKRIIEEFGITFVSSLRNDINYQPGYALRETDNNIIINNIIQLEKSWLRNLLVGSKRCDKLGTAQIYGTYFYILASKLIFEYHNITSRVLIPQNISTLLGSEYQPVEYPYDFDI